METAEIVILAVFIGLLAFLIGLYIGVAIAMEQDEEKQKERMRKTKAYELGREEEKKQSLNDKSDFCIGYEKRENDELPVEYQMLIQEIDYKLSTLDNELTEMAGKTTTLEKENKRIKNQLNDIKQNLHRRR